MFQYLLLYSLTTHFAMFAVLEAREYLGNTDLLRQFYANIIKAVKDEGTRMLDNELTKIYTDEDCNNTQNEMRDMISSLHRIDDFQNVPICTLAGRFGDARLILTYYSQLMAGQNRVFDKLYKRVEFQCPSAGISVTKDEEKQTVQSTDVTLMLTYTYGLGEFMRRSLQPNRFCCTFSQEAKGDANLIQFYLTPLYDRKTLVYGQKVAIGAKGHELTTSEGKLKWDKVADYFEQEWKIKNPCDIYDSYSEVKYCDLVSFYSLYDRKYLGKIYTFPNIQDGTFTILGPDGTIPQ